MFCRHPLTGPPGSSRTGSQPSATSGSVECAGIHLLQDGDGGEEFRHPRNVEAGSGCDRDAPAPARFAMGRLHQHLACPLHPYDAGESVGGRGGSKSRHRRPAKGFRASQATLGTTKADPKGGPTCHSTFPAGFDVMDGTVYTRMKRFKTAAMYWRQHSQPLRRRPRD